MMKSKLNLFFLIDNNVLSSVPSKLERLVFDLLLKFKPDSFGFFSCFENTLPLIILIIIIQLLLL